MGEILGPLDRVLDRDGDEVLQHLDTGCGSMAYSSSQAFDRVRRGAITPQEYARVLVHRQAIRHAYGKDLPFPEGAVIVSPTVQEVKGVAHMVTADLFFRAIQHARQAQASK